MVQLYRSPHEYVAIKKTYCCPKSAYERAKSEAKLLQSLKSHPNVVGVKDAIITETAVYLVLEYIPTHLKQYLHCVRRMDSPYGVSALTEKDALAYIHDVLEAVHHLHKHSIVHRDVKPSNVLLSPDPNRGCIAKLSDFGTAQKLTHSWENVYKPESESTQSECKCRHGDIGTCGYQPPESFLGFDACVVPHAADIWGIGCLLVEILRQGDPLFAHDSSLHSLRSIFNLLGNPTNKTWPSLFTKSLQYPRRDIRFRESEGIGYGLEKLLCVRDSKIEASSTPNNKISSFIRPDTFRFIQELLSLDPFQRPTAGQCLSHSVFSEPFLPRRLPMPLPPTDVLHFFGVAKRNPNSSTPLGDRDPNVIPFTPPPQKLSLTTPPRRLFASGEIPEFCTSSTKVSKRRRDSE